MSAMATREPALRHNFATTSPGSTERASSRRWQTRSVDNSHARAPIGDRSARVEQTGRQFPRLLRSAQGPEPCPG